MKLHEADEKQKIDVLRKKTELVRQAIAIAPRITHINQKRKS